VVRETIIYDTLSDLVGGAELAAQPVARGAPPPAGAKRPSHRKVVQDFVSHLDVKANQRGSAQWTHSDMRREFHESGLANSRPTVDDFIDALNGEGHLILKTLPRIGRTWTLSSASHIGSQSQWAGGSQSLR
jgi:hypothetical protein